MAYGDWNGNSTTTLVAIALVVCFCWVPVLAVLSIFRKCRVRFRAYFEERGWVAPVPDEEKRLARQQKAPEIRIPPPVHNRKSHQRSHSALTYNSAASNETLRMVDTASSWDPIRRFDSASSWDPVRRFDPTGTGSPPSIAPSMARNNSLQSNFSRPIQSRAASVRSVSSTTALAAGVQGRTRRPSTSNGPPVSFQTETAYYDTTPLPTQMPSNIKSDYAKSFTGRSHTSGSPGASSPNRRGTSLDAARPPTPARSPEQPQRQRARTNEEPWWENRPQEAHPSRPMPRVPPRRGSLNATQAPERPCWLDTPYAM
ncbi:hypothetical protein B0T24DRAFT_599483 [Lasiosphaeria ovina]|uniref:Uncharacterized protein n=1 Tax=Lasiosphaeria ovina TaxID=92902 RepID=A0AAE0MYM0_9PEZI|nr:hypothetical protein B0T24DRAFT_599483 [Lasiosphaeria ovina]